MKYIKVTGDSVVHSQEDQRGKVNRQVVDEIMEVIEQHRQQNYQRVLTSFEYFGDGTQIFDRLVSSDETFVLKKRNLFTTNSRSSRQFVENK